MLKKQRIRAYLWLVFIFFTLAGANYFFFRFSFHQMNPLPMTRGLTFGSAIWSAVLLVAMLFHRAWARYILVTWLVMAMVAFAMSTLMMNGQSIAPLPEPTKAAVAGLALYALALVPLGISRSLRRYLGPRTAGGQ